MSTLIKIIKVLLGVGVGLVVAIVIISLIEWRTIPVSGPAVSRGTTTDSQITLTAAQSAQKQQQLTALKSANAKTSLTTSESQSKADTFNSMYAANQH